MLNEWETPTAEISILSQDPLSDSTGITAPGWEIE